jgi:hypothetical protein
MLCLEITIPIASEWPNREELAARNAVEAEIMSAGAGQCIGAGGGMGQMHLAYGVADKSAVPAARTLIADAMTRHMPSFQYSIKVSEV